MQGTGAGAKRKVGSGVGIFLFAARIILLWSGSHGLCAANFVRMRSLSFFAMLVVGMLLAGCGKVPGHPPVSSLHLEVAPYWGDEPFDRNATYDNGNGQRVLLQDLRFYLSDLSLVAGTDTVRIMDADLFMLLDGPVTREWSLEHTIAADAVTFGIGLPPRLNHGDVTSYPVDHPMGNNAGMYWTWATMYRFFLLDGRFANDPNATGMLPFQFSIHTGLDTLFREFAAAVPMPPYPNGTARLQIRLDVAKLFRNGSMALDLAQGSQWHGTVDDLHIGERAADLQQAAFTVAWQ